MAVAGSVPQTDTRPVCIISTDTEHRVGLGDSVASYTAERDSENWSAFGEVKDKWHFLASVADDQCSL